MTEIASSHNIVWLGPNDPVDAFPDVDQALREPEGLLAAGGDLGTERLLAAYVRGIFPWYEEGQPILWWAPDPRCVLLPESLHVSRRLAQQVRSSNWTLCFGRDFAAVVAACAGPRRSGPGTWITSNMKDAYTRLHEEGWAQSIEIWDGRRLVGGMYGLCIGRVFFGESMFSASPNSSKIAMLGLTRHMISNGLELLDCQVASPHLLSLGATTMPRDEFTQQLARACDPPSACTTWPRNPSPVGELL